MKDTVLKVLGWVATLFFALYGLTLFVQSFSVWLAISTIIAIMLCAPPARTLTKKHTGLSASGAPLVFICIFLFFAQTSSGVAGISEREEAQKKSEQQAVAEKAAKQHESDLAYFTANKATVLAEIDKHRVHGEFGNAMKLITKYSALIKDAELEGAKDAINLAQAKFSLKGEAAMPLPQRVALFKTLARLEPTSTQYAKKAEALSTQLERVQAEESAKAARVARAASRTKALEAQFSAWDGSHRQLEAEVKRTMKNPSSYEHVETRYRDNGNGLTISMTFRGTNSFGGVVPNTVTATVDDDGNVLSMRNARE